MKLVSWNVNGIRAIMKKGFPDSIEEMSPDIICLQETKAQLEDAQVALSLMKDYKIYINYSKARKGYSGTAILTKQEPIEVTYDMGLEEHDQEGRVVTAEFEDFYLINVYTPNSKSGLKRLDYRQTWDAAFLDHMVALREKKSVIVCGDLNVAHEDIDIARAKENYNKSAGFTQIEIDGFDNFLSEGWIDTFRHFHPEEVKYTYWNQMFKARDRNVGWRIDYFLVTDDIISNIKEASIHNEHFGSDHCPVSIVLDI